jgi:hypothetical protein
MKTIKNSVKRLAPLFFIASFVLATSCRETPSETNEETSTETTTDVKANTPATNDDIAKNPAHGQTGHRCDIPVGAPLNSAATDNNTSTQSSPLINNTGGGAVTINPPHGQPGHQCGIPVGDPL